MDSQEKLTLDQYITNRQRLINRTEELFLSCEKTPGLFLNLGSGRCVRSGMISIDKYVDGDDRILKMDMYRLEYPDNSVDLIYSSHSLEHLPIRHSCMALKDWYRALKPGGMLFLSMPDLNLVMAGLLNPKDAASRRWLLFTLYGYQADMEAPRDEDDVPLDHGQFHCSGHSLQSLKEELTGIGYRIQEMYNYEGFGTPGVFVEALK